MAVRLRGSLEPDHDPDEDEALRRYLRPINPDPAKWIAETLAKDRRRARKRPQTDKNPRSG